MALHGKIQNYDAFTGTGFIQPDQGGERLPFSRGDLEQQDQTKPPGEQDRFTYDIGKDAAGESCAVHLRRT